MEDTRRAVRIRKSEALLWRRSAIAPTEMGWLLEASKDSCAFAWRGSSPPPIDTVIHINQETEEGVPVDQRAIVRRVASVHDNLCIIAIQCLDDADAGTRRAQVVVRDHDRNQASETGSPGVSTPGVNTSDQPASRAG